MQFLFWKETKSYRIVKYVDRHVSNSLNLTVQHPQACEDYFIMIAFHLFDSSV